MEASTLPQLLKSFCSDSYWTYAVFWKLRHQIPMFLSWEDGYFDHSKARSTVDNCLEKLYFNNTGEKFSIFNETIEHDESKSQFALEHLVADMSTVHYSLGQGLVGGVALTGNYCWLTSQHVLAIQSNSEILLEFHEEWLPQFLAGVKTILFLPVLPHGVLQLGSLETVAEDNEVVANLTESIISFQQVFSNSLTPITNHGLHDHPLPSSMYCSIDDVNESLAKAGSVVHKLNSEGSSNYFEAKDAVQNLERVMPLFQIDEDALGNKINVSETNVSEGLIPRIEPLNQENMGDDEFQFPQPQEMYALAECYIFGGSRDFYDGIHDYCIASDLERLPWRDKDVESSRDEIDDIFRFPVEYEPDEALGATFLGQMDLSFPEIEVIKSSCLAVDHAFLHVSEPFARESKRHCAEVEEHISESVVTDSLNHSDDYSRSSSHILKSPTSPLGQVFSPMRTKRKSQESMLGEDDLVACSKTAMEESTLNTVTTHKEHQNKGPTTGLDKRLKKLTSNSKRNVRSGDNQRTRPRDRQLIQDRVKELRDLVPNGAKCSIDGLLDRTINHMLFLQGVINRAAKLRKSVPSKESGRNRWRALEINASHSGGSSLALEIGAEFQVCPIVVEDLEYPGLMLIEMLCNEQGFFLDIAQVLRCLELTILTGVTKKDSDNTWACFIVEASKGFQRIDIFWPLMQLLQHRRNPLPA